MLMLIGGLIVAYFVYILISRNNDKPSSDPPAMAYVALREIIERAAEEAKKLPGLSASVDIGHSHEHSPIAEHSYEDLLATAIFNKIIEKCQREQRVDGNSNILCNIDLPKAKCTTTEHSFEEEATNHAFCHLECSNDNGALMAGKNKDDCDFMSFMIEERIEEVTTITSDNKLRGNNEFGCTQCVPFPEFGMDIIDPPQNSSSPSSSSESLDNYSRIKTRRVADHTMNLVLSVESWKDNWLFQKKRTSESQSDPVIMLVPSSSADYKALIGDRDAEDTSDLSECSSTRSDEEIEKELLEAINNVIPKIPETSECNAEVNQEVPSIETQFDKEVVTCHTNTNIEKIESVCEKRKKDDKDKTLEILEEKTVKDEENERKRNKGSLLITIVKEEKAKEKFKDTECDTKTIEIKSSVNDVKNIDFENLSEKNDRMENIMEENEEQRESEYTEHYDTAIQRHLDSLTKVEICSEKSETSDNTKQIACTQHGKPENEENNLTVKEPKYSKAHIQLSYATIKENHIKSENDQLSTPPRPGTIAEREHKKWENAPPIENNPYSEESIRKRCLERQYSRNSEIPSVHYKLTKLNEVNLDALLLPERLDIKRFERDYYINQSKSASKEREEWAKLATSSVSSRPNISLSQWSSDEQQHEQQNKPASKEIDSVSILRENRNVTLASWRKDNTEVISSETNNHSLDVNLQKNKNEKNDETTTWKYYHQRTDDILDNQRKNSKNEINAKLNNQEHISECKDDEGQRIRRIDLKTYGFEEVSDQRKKTAQYQRVANKLDLSFYGYENGVLRRSHSNIQLHQPLQNEKSNLTKWTIRCRAGYKEYAKSLDCKKFTNSKDFTKFKNGHIGLRLISAKSMPNVTDDVYYKSSLIYENRAARNLINRTINRSEDELMDECSMTDDSSLLNTYDEISSDVNKSFEDTCVRSKDHTQLRKQVSEVFHMLPSVKRLAEAFGRKQTSKVETTMPAKVMKTDNVKERLPISEVQVVEKPRQMHSLTARSFSKEFREGLRQMPSKVNSLPVSRFITEEQSANQAEVVRSKGEDKDTDVILPGKLRSNIIFWEQLQKKI